MKSIVSSVLNRAPVNYARESIFEPPSSRRSGHELEAMEAQSTIFAIVDRIATKVASVEWNLYRGATAEANAADEDPAAIVKRHAALSVWNNPNPHYTRTELVETTQQHFELSGEQILINVRPKGMSQGPPIELWPIRPDRMIPIPSVSEFIAGWIYVGADGREKVRLTTDEVMRVKRPNPTDPYRGLGPIGSLILDIEGEQAAAEWNAAFFRNGAEPGGIIEVPELMEDKEFEKMQEHWNSQHKGVRNAHRVAVVEVGQWKDRRYTMRDMQFEQLRRFSRETIRTAWTFPKPMLGDVEDVNRANADAGIAIFAEGLLIPRLNRWRTLLNADFLPQFGAKNGTGYHFNYADPVPPNRQEEGQNQRLRALNAASFVEKGFDPVGTLEAFGFPPIEYIGPPKDVFAEEHKPEPVPEPEVPAPDVVVEEPDVEVE